MATRSVRSRSSSRKGGASGHNTRRKASKTSRIEKIRKRALDDWGYFLVKLFPQYVTAPLADHHFEFWEWVWDLKSGVSPDPQINVWPRGGAKSTSAELAVVTIAARRQRKYGLYVCGTQEQADDHVGNVAGMFEADRFAAVFPDLAQRSVGKYGNVKGWRRNRLRTSGGFTIDAIGLDTAARGVKLDEARPDFLIIDDIDEDTDTLKTTEKKIDALTKKLIPAGSRDLAVLAIQNLVSTEGVFARLVDGRADFLQNRIVSGPVPALYDAEFAQVEDQKTKRLKWVVVKGTPSWEGQDMQACQEMIDRMGFTAFKSECQHDVEPPPGGMFDHLTFMHEKYEDIKHRLVRKVCWVDPAVTDTDRSDSQAISIAGLSDEGLIYKIWSWEKRCSPKEAIVKALEMGVAFGCEKIGVETDQGGETWESVIQVATQETGLWLPFDYDKAGAGHGSKVHRASQMLFDYERGHIIHCVGTHHVLEAGLRRFPRTKPFDLVDASYWSWYDLVEVEIPDGLVEYEERVEISEY